MTLEQLSVQLELQRGLLRINGKRESQIKGAIVAEMQRIAANPNIDLDELIVLTDWYREARSDARANLIEIARIKREMQKA